MFPGFLEKFPAVEPHLYAQELFYYLIRLFKLLYLWFWEYKSGEKKGQENVLNHISPYVTDT